MRPRAIACAILAALALSGAANAHVTSVPTFVTAGQRETITFVAPNERQVGMNGFTVTVPSGLTITATPPSDGGWEGTARGSTASWSGCCVAGGRIASFSLGIEAGAEPGDVSLDVRQLYPGDAEVRWPVPLTVLPGGESSSSLGTVLLVAVLGLVVTVGLVLVAWLRRARPLEER